MAPTGMRFQPSVSCGSSTPFPEVAPEGHVFTHRPVGFPVRRRPCSQAVHITVVHAKGSCDQYRIVNFSICGSFGFGLRNVCLRHFFAALLYMAGNFKQGPEFGGEGRMGKSLPDLIYQVCI